MKNNSFKIFIISSILVVISLVLIIYVYDKKTIMVCKRHNGDVVTFKFDNYGIKSMKINNKKVIGIDLLSYKMNFVNKITFSSSDEDKDNYDEIKEYMDDVADYEKYYSDYHSTCDFSK